MFKAWSDVVDHGFERDELRIYRCEPYLPNSKSPSSCSLMHRFVAFLKKLSRKLAKHGSRLFYAPPILERFSDVLGS